MKRETPESEFEPRRTSELLAALAQGQSPSVEFGAVTERFGIRGFGILLVLAALAGLLPSPVGAGTLAGLLGGLVGLQMLLGLERPALPRWLTHKSIKRDTFIRWVAGSRRVLGAIERVAAPRKPALFTPIANRFTGLALLVHSVIVALPIPLTNYPLALVLLLVAIALIEDDGVLLAIGWVLMVGVAIGLTVASGAAYEALETWIH